MTITPSAWRTLVAGRSSGILIGMSRQSLVYVGADASGFIRIFAGWATSSLYREYHLARKGRLALGVAPTLDVMTLLLKLSQGSNRV